MAQPDSVADALEGASSNLDRLIQDRRLGPRNPRQHHDDEERAQAIAARILAAFRGPAAQSAPPLKVTDRGAWY
jgi:hypothetical protein